MTSIIWLPALLRATTTALLVVMASTVAETVGPFWAALVASLPVSAGPAYLFLALDHGADFVAESSLGSLVANAATGLFLIVYGRLAGSLTPWRTLGAAIVAWLAAILALRQITWHPLTALLLNVAVYGAGFRLLSAVGSVEPQRPRTAERRWLEVALRAVAVGLFVTLVVAVSSELGPAATGLAAVFPVSLISLIAILSPRIGDRACALLAAEALRSMLGFGIMLLVLHLMIGPWGIEVSFGAALLVVMFWSSALFGMRRLKIL